MTMVRSLKDGKTATERRLEHVVNTDTFPTSTPTLADQGVHLRGADFLHIYAVMTGITGATVTPYYWSDIAGVWFADDAIALTSTVLLALVEVRGETRLKLVINSVTGTGSLDLWAGYSYEGQDQ